MPHPSTRIYFDFVDPLSYAVSCTLDAQSAGADNLTPTIEWIGFELRPYPTPLTATRDPMWAGRWAQADEQAAALNLSFAPPPLVPWTRKAHELHTFGCQQGAGDAIRAAIFGAYFTEGKDIGRVDVLVDLASAAGLDRTGTKAVLDVDRHEADVASARRAAETLGVRDVPSLSVDGRLVEGFPDLTDLGTLLPDR